MEIKIQDINFINELRNLSALVDSHNSVLTQCIESKCNINNNSFQIYQNKYNDYCRRFKEKKHELELKYIIPILGSNIKYNWELNYDTGIITIKI